MKRIAIVTGTRAEYGLLKPLIFAILEDKNFELKLIVTGMHLLPEFGETYKEIENDGLCIDAKIYDGLSGDSAKAITESMGKSLIGFAQVFDNLNPDLLIVLGDRTEILSAATAAVVASIPIAHIHGGETTEGAYDEFIRHAVTKMSHFHFTATEVYRKRVIQLGEDPKRVFNVGAIGIDSIKNISLLDKNTFEGSIGLKLKMKSILITFHPVTLEKNTSNTQFRAILASLEKLEDTTFIFTKPNTDKGGKTIIELIDSFVNSNKDKAISFNSLGQLRYLSALQFVDVVIGNSSSGIIEVPAFKKPTINIGDRQKGRIMPVSVINCDPFTSEIDKAIQKAYNTDFLKLIETEPPLFGNGTATKQILKVINNFRLDSLKKPFYDISF